MYSKIKSIVVIKTRRKRYTFLQAEAGHYNVPNATFSVSGY